MNKLPDIGRRLVVGGGIGLCTKHEADYDGEGFVVEMEDGSVRWFHHAESWHYFHKEGN